MNRSLADGLVGIASRKRGPARAVGIVHARQSPDGVAPVQEWRDSVCRDASRSAARAVSFRAGVGERFDREPLHGRTRVAEQLDESCNGIAAYEDPFAARQSDAPRGSNLRPVRCLTLPA